MWTGIPVSRWTRSAKPRSSAPPPARTMPVHGDVGRQLGRRLLERGVDGGHDVGQRGVDRAADLLAVELELAREAGEQVAAPDAGGELLGAAATRSRPRA